jgi:hypothetical protein
LVPGKVSKANGFDFGNTPGPVSTSVKQSSGQPMVRWHDGRGRGCGYGWQTPGATGGKPGGGQALG